MDKQSLVDESLPELEGDADLHGSMCLGTETGERSRSDSTSEKAYLHPDHQVPSQ